ncbi:T6SS effector BTH_I2691 family protein [Salinicola sp. JS01]|uniref:T6SS effector BTH_I2691 family protein n=1 Tax=Salinicola sp. JS01 TaxID=3050071 RepID=UPI00255B7E37|nr:T6SS effector BTH_I2691 family protein [Salinicola sp. JS01]WIX34211.1 T6SS effector BTH_I2691 family protein [Salinicola sp. JS01]
MTAPSQAGAHAAENEAAGQESGRCQFCERKGLPILPVRYAVCQRNDRNGDIPELETSRIQEFTDILLDKSLVGGEEQARSVPDEVRAELTQSTGSQVNKYILRQLRQGYLYFYDQDNPDQNHWYAYAITSDGKYYQFPVLQPRALDEIKFPESCQAKPGDVLDASIVTLPFPEKSGTLYYAFSEHPWSNAHIQMIGSDEAWRKAHMQQVNIPAWVSGQRQSCAFGIDELEKVAEYSAAAGSLDEQFWSSGPVRSLFKPGELRDAMQRRLDHAGGEYQGKGLILAVKDEIGIIDELNAYRHQALASVEEFFYNKEEEEDEAQIHNVRRRKLLCMQAIDAFKKNFARSYVASQEQSLSDKIDKARAERDAFQEEEYSRENSSPRERAQHQRRLGQLNRAVREAETEKEDFLRDQQQEAEELREERQRLTERISQLEHEQAELDRRAASSDPAIARQAEMQKQTPFIENELQHKRFLLQNLKSEAQRAADRHADQLDELYDSDALDRFRADYEENTAHCQSLAAVFDDDYAIWARHGLPAVIGRYSQSDYWTGLGLSGLIGNALRGGIISPSSGGLWKLLADDLESSESPLLAALFANDAEMIAQARERLGSLPAGSQLSAQTLKSWGERFQQVRARTQKPDGRAPTSDQIISRWRPIQDLLATTVGNSIASLVLYRAAGVPAPDYKPALSQFVRYHQLAFMADPQALDGEQPAPTMVEREIKLSELYQWLRAVSQASAKKPNQGADTSKAMKSLDGMVGNFSAPMADSDRTVRIALPVYVDIKAVTGGSGAEIPADSYTPSDEQQRLSDLAQNARDIGNTLFSAHKGSGQVAGACLVLWSLIVSWQEGAFEDEEEGADWSKIIGSSISLAGGAMAGIEGYHKIRMASLGLSTEGAMIGGVKWAFVSDVLGAAGGMISIWDGLKKLTEANEASKTGQSLTGHYGMIVGGVGVIAGIASIVVISASTVVGVFVGLFVGLVTLLVGFIFVTMVSPAVQMWVNRSILGKPSEREDMQVLPFDDMASEQSSLEMVFQGVLVELSWSPVRPDTNQYIESPYDIDMEGLKAEVERARKNVTIDLTVKLPALDSMEVDLRLISSENVNTLFEWRYQKVSKDAGLDAVVAMGSESSSSQPSFSKNGGFYVMECERVFDKSDLGGSPQLILSFLSKKAVSRLNDTFELVI